MTIQEIDFGKIQKDRISEMKRWVRFVKKAKEEQRDRLNLAIVASNNHYAGFGPGTSNTFRKMLDLSEVTWNDVKVPQAERAARQSQDGCSQETGGRQEVGQGSRSF